MTLAPNALPRLLAGLDSSGAPLSLAAHERIHGLLPEHPAQELIELVHDSGLRGRGGADFPMAQKLRAVGSRGSSTVVVVNGSETEPGSAKDRLLLSRLPHLVLDGAVLAARAVASREVIIKLGEHVGDPAGVVRAAIAARPPERVRIKVAVGPSGYVTGEETAVLNHLSGGASVPTFVPPRPFERGLGGRPTLVQNPETLAQVALVARYGARWYRELGTEADPGSALVTISGAVRTPGVYELAFGTSMRDLVAAAGGPSEPLQALLVGGYFGTWVTDARISGLRLAREDLRSVGCALGSGVLIALGESACGLHESARVVDYLATQSAGQCGPCVFGLRAIADAMAALADGVAQPGDRERLARLGDEVKGRGACHHPDGVVRFVQSSLEVFAEEIEWHRHYRCEALPAGLSLPAHSPTAGGRGTGRPLSPSVGAAR